VTLKPAFHRRSFVRCIVFHDDVKTFDALRDDDRQSHNSHRRFTRMARRFI